MAGFLGVRSRLFDPDAAATTFMNLVDQPGLARFGIAADLTIVLTQALTALWFYKLFRGDNRFAAVAIAVFGMVNAIVILVATGLTTTALGVASEVGLAPGGDQAGTVQLLYQLSENLWLVGALFFGLWLIPMGYVVVTTKVMPVMLGWILVLGGIGYIMSGYAKVLVPDQPIVADGLSMLATVGEIWMVGYLLSVGRRDLKSSDGRSSRDVEDTLSTSVASS